MYQRYFFKLIECLYTLQIMLYHLLLTAVFCWGIVVRDMTAAGWSLARAMSMGLRPTSSVTVRLAPLANNASITCNSQFNKYKTVHENIKQKLKFNIHYDLCPLKRASSKWEVYDSITPWTYSLISYNCASIKYERESHIRETNKTA